MRKKPFVVLLAFVLSLAAAPGTGLASDPPILGKWILLVDTPNGELEVELELRLEGERLTGSAYLFENTVSLASAAFADQKILIELNLGAASFRLAGLLQDGRLSGIWEQMGGEANGTWSGARKPAPAPPPAAGSIAGEWESIAATPEGDLAFVALLKQEGQAVTGSLGAADGSFSIPMKNVAFSDGKLVFEVDYLGGTFRIQARLAEGKLIGIWESLDGSLSGAWSATRKSP